MARVARNQRICVARQSDLQEGQVVCIRRLHGARARDDLLAVSLELTHDLSNIVLLEAEPGTRQHLGVLVEELSVEQYSQLAGEGRA